MVDLVVIEEKICETFQSCRRKRNVIVTMSPEIRMPEINVTNEIKIQNVLPQPVPTTPLQEGPSANQLYEDHHPAGKTLGDVSSSLPSSLTTSRNRMLVTIFNDEYANKDGGEVEKLSAIKDNTQMIKEVLKNKYGYEMPSEDPTIFDGRLENQTDPVKKFEVFLKKWKRAQPVGRTIDRFILFYHGHGVQARV